MRISPERLFAEAQATGFRPNVLEKVAQLLGLLNAIRSHPFLRDRLALKGGTALNLFVFDVPRLSVDIDLNYVGAASQSAMLEERPRLEAALQAVFSREDFTIRRMPSEHAGGKWSLRYPTAAGQTGRIDVDVNYLYRVPLWPVGQMDSHPVGSWRATDIPVLDIHELAAGRQEPVLELLEQVDRLPGAVVCDREDTAALLAPITRALDIGLYVGPTPALDIIKDDLLATILN